MTLFSLLMVLAGAVVTEVPAESRFLLLDEDEQAIGVLDANSIVRSGDTVQVIMTAAFAEPADDLWVLRVREEADCRTGQLRYLESGAFTIDFRLAEQSSGPLTGWETPPAGSRTERTVRYLCRGEALPEAGTDFRTIANAYWSRLRGERVA